VATTAILEEPKNKAGQPEMRTWALSAFRKAGYESLTKAMRLCKHDLPKLSSFL